MKEVDIKKIVNDNKPSNLIKNLYKITGVGNYKLRITYISIAAILYVIGIVLDNTGHFELMKMFVIPTSILLAVLVLMQLAGALLNNRRILKISKLLGVENLDEVSSIINRYEV